MAEPNCEAYFAFEMCLLAFFGIICTVQCAVTFLALRQIIALQSQKKKFTKLSLLSYWVLYLSSAMLCISRVGLSVAFCFDKASEDIFWLSVGLSYMAHLTALLLTLYARLRDVFEETAMRISQCASCCFLVVMTCLCVTGLSVFAVPGLPVLFILSVIFLVILVTAQALTWYAAYASYLLVHV